MRIKNTFEMIKASKKQAVIITAFLAVGSNLSEAM